MMSLLYFLGLFMVALSAALVIVRKASFACFLASYGTPLALLLASALLVAVCGRWILLILTLFSTMLAVLCAFYPKRISFALAVAISLFAMCLSVIIGLAPIIFGGYALSLFFSCIGVVLKEDIWKKREIEEKEPKPSAEDKADPKVMSTGFLYLLAGAYDGERLQLPDGEELRMGNDAAACHLILDISGMSPCLCGVRWLRQRNTYLVTCYVPNALLREDGHPLPGNGTVETKPGEVFLDRKTGRPLFQTG